MPNTGKWQGDETPEIVVLQREDDPTKMIAVSKADFERDYVDTGETKSIEESAKFD